jgi:hypothetical protein
MAKVTIEFDTIEDKDEMDWCLNGLKWYSLAWELDQYLRNRLKHEELVDEAYLRGRLKYEDNLSEDAYKALDEVRAKLHELRREENLSFD